jgi:HEAT repeat protein
MTAGDDARRRRAVALAGHQGDEALVRRSLDDPAPSVRATAVGALERLGALTPEDLARFLADPSPLVQRRACEATTGVPGTSPPSLLPLLTSADSTVAEVAAWASGEREPPEAGVVPVLAALATDHDDALVREAAVAALGSIGDEAGLPAVLAATTDKATVRRRAVLALAPFEGEEVDAALEKAKQDRDWQVRQAAEDLSP